MPYRRFIIIINLRYAQRIPIIDRRTLLPLHVDGAFSSSDSGLLSKFRGMSGIQRHPVRVGRKVLGVAGILSFTALIFILRLRLTGKARSIEARAVWLQQCCRRLLRFLNVRVRYTGEPPDHGLLVSNHVSYLDILVLGQRRPMVFVSKSEVRAWPFLGWLTACAGTLFIKRASKGDVLRIAEEFSPLIEQGSVIGLFPEGTSSDGRQVLPFRSSLLEPAVAKGWPVSAAWIGYSLQDGSVPDEVCYWGDMGFGSHLLNLLSKERIDAWVAYGSPVEPGMNRKQMARALHARVCALKGLHESGGQSPDPDRVMIARERE